MRDGDVIAAIEALRPGGLLRGQNEVQATWAGRSESIRVIAVETETVAGRGQRIVLKGQRTERSSGRPAFVDAALGGKTPEEMTELALRVALFGEENPLGLMSFMAEMANPFVVIDALGLPEDSVESIAHLLLTESVVSSGRAERLTELQVGPKYLGGRRVAVAWRPRRRYTNALPENRRIEGEVRSNS